MGHTAFTMSEVLMETRKKLGEALYLSYIHSDEFFQPALVLNGHISRDGTFRGFRDLVETIIQLVFLGHPDVVDESTGASRTPWVVPSNTDDALDAIEWVQNSICETRAVLLVERKNEKVENKELRIPVSPHFNIFFGMEETSGLQMSYGPRW
eukprot:TRINITY_DN2011_c0_g1_i2.p1 TRINITY_DN2011_c0_g1~~TRINITY_DN2011_c0_g1_i2.p1  ORF type:complete len:153 (+),score=23.02 TRINITY_DN2011_c0_g1_i2:236-694(+)